MLIIKPSKIYISSANVDMRKAIDGLSGIVQGKFKLDPMSDAMFVFHNRHCDKIKILYWDGNGFCLLYKRMEKGRFYFPKHLNSCALQLIFLRLQLPRRLLFWGA